MKFCRILAKTTVAAAIIVMPPFSSRADVLISNLAEPLRDASPIGNTGVLPPPPVGDWSWAAQSFSSDGNPYMLDSIDAIVGDGTTEPFPAVVAELHGDDNGLVGALITTFTAPDVSGALTARTFLPDNPVTLSANEKYWFVLGAVNPSDGTYFWGYAAGNGSMGSGAFVNYSYSFDSGMTWTDFGSDDPFLLQVDVSPLPIVDADFNDDGLLDCLDVDALVVEIATNTQNLAFDLTGDAMVNILDLDQWRSDAGAVNLPSMNPYLPGDADLDGVVDGADFITWNANKFTEVAAWCSGDFNADGFVDGSDFIIWNGNKFTSADTQTTAVPEPVWCNVICMLTALGPCWRSRRVTWQLPRS